MDKRYKKRSEEFTICLMNVTVYASIIKRIIRKLSFMESDHVFSKYSKGVMLYEKTKTTDKR